jgi:hypothetical protein
MELNQGRNGIMLMQRRGPMGKAECEARALEASAATARSAFVCPYSSSAEYEAEIIKARRAEGAYGPSWRRLPAWVPLAGAAAILLLGYALARA